MALENTDMLLVHLLLGAEAFLLVHFASSPDSQHRCGYINCVRVCYVCVYVCVCGVCSVRILCVWCVHFVRVVCVVCGGYTPMWCVCL